MLVALLAAAAVIWFALLVTAPALPPPLAAALYAIGAFICHQRPERSFHLDAIQLPVCARCVGIYGGAALGIAARLLPGWDAPIRPRALLIAGAVPTLLMVAMEVSGLWETSNLARAAAGIWLGAAVAVAVIPGRFRARAGTPQR